jgi:hypothetical protein
MEAVMNGGSDLTLALAVEDAGAFPSYWYHSNDQLYDDITEFIKCTGHANIVVGGLAIDRFTDIQLLKIINQLKVSHIEILATDHRTGNFLSMTNVLSDSKVAARLDILKQTSKLMTRIYEITDCDLSSTYFDGYCIKGKESAGKSGNYSVSELFDIQKINSHNCLIPYGGVGTPWQVKDYLDRGAAGVAVGTLFAASRESSLSNEAKQQIIKANSSTLTRLTDTNQNSLLLDVNFKAAMPTAETDWNRQNHLDQGLRGNGTEGLLYIGAGVDHVNEVKSVKDIVKYLVSELEYK